MSQAGVNPVQTHTLCWRRKWLKSILTGYLALDDLSGPPGPCTAGAQLWSHRLNSYPENTVAQRLRLSNSVFVTRPWLKAAARDLWGGCDE